MSPEPDDVSLRNSPRDDTIRRSADVIPRSVIIKACGFGVVVLGLIVFAYFVPMPSIGYLRSASEGLGPWFPVVFFTAYAVITVGPIPRTFFTVSAGVLFGPWVGALGALIATTIAAVAAFYLARRFGRQRVQRFLNHPLAEHIEYRLDRRGWLAVGSLRLIAACPFSVCNYLAGLSSVRFVPYLLATVVCVTPGTVAVVILGDVLIGGADPALLAISVSCFALGLAGLWLDWILD